MKREILACLALCCATLAHAGWFDNDSDVPPSIKVERAAGGNDQWNGTMFYTQSTISREGKPVVQREDGIYYDGRKIVAADKKLGWLHVQMATVCQKNNTLFYGQGNAVFTANLDGAPESKLLYTFPAPGNDPELGPMSLGMSVVTTTNDCTKLAVSAVYIPKDVTKRSDGFHTTLGAYDKYGRTSVVVGSLDSGKWSFKEVLATKGWYSHSLIEPVKGEKIILYKNGDKDVARNKGMVMNADGSNLKMLVPNWDTSGSGRVGLCSWVGDGHTTACVSALSGTWYYVFTDTDTMKIAGTIKTRSFPEASHEIAVRYMKNGNILFVGDSFNNRMFYGEIDLKNEKIVRFAKVASHGKLRPENNHLLPNDEGWYPHPNISQDGKYIAFASRNDIGEKGSDVFVISGLPE